jgi:hypothetical protein
MRIDEVPVADTNLTKNAEAPGGIGEAPTAIVSAAVNNAIFDAAGKRPRSLPISTDELKSSSESCPCGPKWEDSVNAPFERLGSDSAALRGV